jgi:hypothetical protein
LNVAHKKKGVKAGIVNAGKPLPMLSVQDAVNESIGKGFPALTIPALTPFFLWATFKRLTGQIISLFESMKFNF